MRLVTACGLAALLASSATLGGPYVTETSGIRWNDVGGVRWSDVGGVRWSDVGGVRWNDVGGVRWSDVGDTSFTDASAIHWSDATGIRYTDAGAITFDGAGVTGEASIDLPLLGLLSTLPDSSEIDVVVTYFDRPTPADLAALQARGVLGGTLMRRLPMVVVSATKQQVRQIAALPHVRSVFANATLSLFDQDSASLVAVPEASRDSVAACRSSNTFCLLARLPARCQASPSSPPPRSPTSAYAPPEATHASADDVYEGSRAIENPP